MPLVFSDNEQYACPCFTALAHLGAILPKLAKYPIMIGWEKNSATDGFHKTNYFFVLSGLMGLCKQCLL